MSEDMPLLTYHADVEIWRCTKFMPMGNSNFSLGAQCCHNRFPNLHKENGRGLRSKIQNEMEKWERVNEERPTPWKVSIVFPFPRVGPP